MLPDKLAGAEKVNKSLHSCYLSKHEPVTVLINVKFINWTLQDVLFEVCRGGCLEDRLIGPSFIGLFKT